MKFRPVPNPISDQGEINRAVKENLETLAGLRNNRIQPLATTATNAEIIAKINELIDRVQA